MVDNINRYPLQLFVIGDNKDLGNEIAQHLGIRPADETTIFFPDGERLPHQLETVRDRDVYIICTSQNGDKMDGFLIDYSRFVHSVKDGSPHRITVLLPKWPHQRQDVRLPLKRKRKMTGWYATHLKADGADRIITCRLHNPATVVEDPPMENIETDLLIIEEIQRRFPDLSKIAIAVPDLGAKKAIAPIIAELGLPLIIVDKNRDDDTNESKPMLVYTEGKISPDIDTVFFIDDIISSANTLTQASVALALQFEKIKTFIGIGTHADFIEPKTHRATNRGKISTSKNLLNSNFNEIWLTDTVPINRKFIRDMEKKGKKVVKLPLSLLFAQTIANLHNGESVSHLWDPKNRKK